MSYNNNHQFNFIPAHMSMVSAKKSETQHHPLSEQPPLYQNVVFGNGMMTVRTDKRQPHSFPSPIFGLPRHTPPFCHDSTKHTPTDSWDSAGIIVIEDKYHDMNGFTYQAIFLGLNPNSGKYELFYGKRDASDSSPVETATRECSKETANLFRFSQKVFEKSNCVFSHNKKHRAYVIKVQTLKHGIKSKIFNRNLSILRSSRAPHCWSEMSALTRISIKNAILSGILEHTNGDDFSMFDVYDNPITIFCRDAQFIRDAIKAKINVYSPVHTLRFIKFYDDKFNRNKNIYLNGTSSYIV
jgi:hypothetical protein